MQKYYIKKLDWKEERKGYFTTKTIFGPMTITDRTPTDPCKPSSIDPKKPWCFSWIFREYNDDGWEFYSSLEEAKERAEQFIFSRLEKALDKVD